MVSSATIYRRLTAHLLALALTVGTTISVMGSDRINGDVKREGANMTEANPTAQSAQAGQSTIEDQKSVAITVYNSNIGLVKDTRTIRLPRGASQLRFMDVAQQINPTTVHIKSVAAPNALEVIEQSYEYDLLNPQKLLDKYVGKELTLVLRTMDNNTEKLTATRATLLSNNSGQVWQMGQQIVINPTNIAEIRFDRLPQDLIAKPTLVWSLNNTGGDSHTVEASYLTQGMNWRADYVVVVNQNDTKADLNDQSGAQQFIGENRIDHTPKDESVKVKLGDAFDVVAERKQTDYKNIARRVFEYAYEIRIRNHKEEAVTIVVNEPIGGDWEMVSSSFPAEKTAAFAARFNVPVAKDGEAVLSYRVRVKY